MKEMVLLFFILLLSISVWAQANFWRPANELWGGRIDGIAAYGGNLFAIRNSNVFLSTNGGDTWTSIGGSGVTNINCTAINASGHLYLGVTFRGVWWTTNNGNSWSNNQITRDPHSGLGASIYAIGIDSQGHIFTPGFRSFDGGNSWQEINPPSSVNVFASGSQNQIFIGTNDGVYLSTNSASTWTARNSGIENIIINDLGIDANGDLYAGSSQDGIFYSSDEGLSWSTRNTGLGSLKITSIHIAPNGDIYAGTEEQGVYRSTDKGITWMPVNGSLPDLRVRTIATGMNSELYIGTEGSGIFKSTDHGATWAAKNQNINIQYLNAGLRLISNDFLLGTQGSGIFQSPDGQSGWTAKNNGLTNLLVTDFAVGNSGDVFAGTYAGVFRSSDAGENWSAANTGIENKGIVQLERDPSGRLYALTNAQPMATLFYSDDNGNSWNSIPIGMNDIFIESMAVSSQGYLFLSGFNLFLEGIVLISSDGGNTWSDTALTSFSPSGGTLAIDNSDRLYAVFSGESLFYTDNNETTWSTINASGLPNSSKVNHLAFDSNNHIYAATQSNGIYYSENAGSNWTAINGGLPATNGYYPSFNFLYVDPADVVFGGTSDDGLFIGNSVTTAIDDSGNFSTQFSLQQNYPNPFNPATTIGFTIADQAFVKLAIYDLLGREVATLINEEKSPGDYTIEFDAAKLSSGIYFYRLEAGNFKQTRRMILMQ
jgi:photosystem II stability/assembly factor-like uncharacterized protein